MPELTYAPCDEDGEEYPDAYDDDEYDDDEYDDDN